MSKETVTPISVAKTHTVYATALQRMSLLHLLRTCDITKNHLAATGAITAVQGDWPRNRSIEPGVHPDGTPKLDKNGEPVHDERDDSADFDVSEEGRGFLAEFLSDFFECKLQKTVGNGMGGTRQEVINPNGADTIELYPLYQSLIHK